MLVVGCLSSSNRLVYLRDVHERKKGDTGNISIKVVFLNEHETIFTFEKHIGFTFPMKHFGT